MEFLIPTDIEVLALGGGCCYILSFFARSGLNVFIKQV